MSTRESRPLLYWISLWESTLPRQNSGRSQCRGRVQQIGRKCSRKRGLPISTRVFEPSISRLEVRPGAPTGPLRDVRGCQTSTRMKQCFSEVRGRTQPTWDAMSVRFAGGSRLPGGQQRIIMAKSPHPLLQRPMRRASAALNASPSGTAYWRIWRRFQY